MRSRYALILTMAALAAVAPGCRHRGVDPSKEEHHEKGAESASVLPDSPATGSVSTAPHRHEDSETDAAAIQSISLTPEEAARFGIKTEKPQHRKLNSYLEAMGKVYAHPMRAAIVAYGFPARVAVVHARIGQWVETGDLLVTLESNEVGEAKSEFIKALTSEALARQQYDREKGLYEKGVAARKSIQEAEAGLKQAETSLDAAHKRLHVMGFDDAQIGEIAETRHIDSRIGLQAPISGKVTRSSTILGALVDANNEIMTVMDPRLLCVDAQVFERDIPAVHTGQEARVTVPAYPGDSFSGKISYVGDELNEETRTITVRFEVINSDMKLKPGMFATVQIVTREAKDAITISTAALLSEQGRSLVFVSGQGTYSPRFVELGSRENGWVELLDRSLETADIVVDGAFSLKARLQAEKMHGVHLH